MENKSDQKLEELIHRELAKLPELQAPNTLIPRVLAAIQAQKEKNWWQRSWFHWPFRLRVFSTVFLAALVSLMAYGAALVWPTGPDQVFLKTIQPWLESFTVATDILTTLANAAGLVLNSVGKFWLFVSLTIAFMMYLSCVGIGTICFRLSINKR